MGLKVNPSLRKYVDDLVAASIAAHIHAMIKTGTYVGNGADNRNINIGVDLAAKSNVYIIIKSENSQEPRHRIEYGQGDFSMGYISFGDIVDAIQSFTNTGFQIGLSLAVNENTKVFRYMVWWQEN